MTPIVPGFYVLGGRGHLPRQQCTAVCLNNLAALHSHLIRAKRMAFSLGYSAVDIFCEYLEVYAEYSECLELGAV